MSFILYSCYIFLTFIGCLYMWYRLSVFQYWKKKGIEGPTPTFFIGNMGKILIGKENLGDMFTKVYYDTKHLRFGGVYMLHKPVFLINDIEVIKAMLVKDFSHFLDHNLPIDEMKDPISSHLFNLTGEKWKHLRQKLSPTFTTNKMKGMFDTIAKCAQEMNLFLEEDVSKDAIVDVKDMLAKMNTDVIGSCAFGIECNSFKNPDAEFRRMGKKIFEGSLVKTLIEFMTFMTPALLKFYKKSMTGKEIDDFFYNTVKNTIEYREKNNVIRNDFLQLLIQLKNHGVIDDDSAGTKEEVVNDGTRLTTMQVAAQVFVFFIAGFETSSSTASFALYELSLNPDIQDTLREEIDEVLAKHDNKITYDALGEMSYLNRVIEETLRKYPPLPLLFRLCTKNYLIPGTDITIEKDTPVMIPILGIQRDPEYFPEPDKFDPERFTPENKAARHHFSYLPFGEGPRICIGSRFGMMQTKLGLVSILSKYELSVCEKTSIPMVFDKKAVLMIAEGGVWLKLKKRTK